MVYIAKKRLHLARDGKTVVEPGDPRSASLLINEGGEMSDDDARKYGLLPPKGGASDALPLEITGAPKTSDQQPSTVTGGTGSSAADELAKQFPQNLQFGGQKKEEPPPPPPPPAPPPETQGASGTPPPGEQTPPPPPPGNDQEIPDSFPYKSILKGQGLVTVAQVKAATKEQLLELNQIGSERADVIMTAAEKL